MLLTLVDSHYVLSKMAQSRNLEDAATVEEFGALSETVKTSMPSCCSPLPMAWARATKTGPIGRRGWCGRFIAARANGSKAESMPWSKAAATVRRRSMVLETLGEGFRDEADAHFQFMPTRYFQMYEPLEIADHMRLFRSFFENRATDDGAALSAVFKWIPRPEKGYTEVWVCGWDRPRLLERIACAFLSARLNILSADIFTRTDSLALDIFRVAGTDPMPITSPRDIVSVEKHRVRPSFTKDYDFRPLLSKETRLLTYRLSQEFDLPTIIKIDNESHPVYTLIDIQTPDPLGRTPMTCSARWVTAGSALRFRASPPRWMSRMDSFDVYGRDGEKIISDTCH
jgi:[protein-PII] uridylyltransferase